MAFRARPPHVARPVSRPSLARRRAGRHRSSGPDRPGGLRPLLLVGLLVGLTLAFGTPVPAAAESDAAPARFVALAPARLADTRQGTCACTRIDASTIRVRVAGRGGVPAGASAAALTVTAASTTTGSYATVWPSGRARPIASVLNWAAGETRANGTLVPLGADGSIDVYVDGSFAAADIVVDVTGAFVPAGSARSGRFQALPATRALDTRGRQPLQAGGTARIPLPADVAADATALVVNVTATGASGAGYLTAWAAGSGRPATSVVNTDAPGQTRAATAIVPVTHAGLEVAASTATHVIVDVVGWFTGSGADAASAGLFVSVAPTRMFDTRRAGSPLAPDSPQRAYADDDAVAPLVARASSAASALVVNTTATGAGAGGYVSTFPAHGRRPPTSSLNWGPGETVANLTVIPTSTAGVSFVGSTAVHLVTDVTGYFTGTPAAADVSLTVAGGERDPQAVELVAAGVTAAAMRTLAGADIGFLPGGGMAANDTCVGQVGIAGSSMIGTAEDVWQISAQELSLARGLLDACAHPMQAPSVAAHEASHLLIDRWLYEPTNAVAQHQRRGIVDALDGTVECLAEAVAQAMFAARGIGPYQAGYGGVHQRCAGAPSSRSLARQLLTVTG